MPASLVPGRIAPVLILALAAAACRDDYPSTAPYRGRIAIVGDDQVGRPGVVLAEPLVVRVTDHAARPLEVVRVSWAIVGLDDDGAVTPRISLTNAEGLASAVRTMPYAVGVWITIARLPDRKPVQFTSTVQ